MRNFLAKVAALCWLLSGAAYANDIENIRIWPAPDNTRVVFDLSSSPDYSYFTLYQAPPYRLVIDFNTTKLNVDLAKLQNESLLIKKIRTSTPKDKNSTRIVLELSDKIDAKVFPLAANDRYGERLVIDLPGRSIERRTEALTVEQLKERKVTIAIDAGHGGDDPGSIGPRGTYEKHVVLKIAKALADIINQDSAMQAYLIRSGDYYVGLKARTRKAEDINADLLVSIHADAFTSPQPRGASVWVLSTRRANNEMGRMLEDKERMSDVLGGVDMRVEEDDTYGYISKTILDLSMGHAMSTGYEMAKEVIAEMKRVAHMHKHEPQHASLAVLTSGNVPSMLVETGFISNPQEEQQLLTNKHQQQLARAIYQGVRNYFQRRPPDGTLFATSRSKTHIVRSGESLSVLAQRYNTTVKAIKEQNRLSSNVLHIGQKLEIPSS
ncbi:N-acetylmuramoyl-L-alanine amidase [Pseudidiomarina andamanensis]|uniref:N-acetylmuramoyl-L-alanine amidase n=1 Tax=Pseudidiomarina andamanensis TaxID=1940690 RepID=A0AA92IN35_9GAMM|nr:N-acetylmuramoyl-L-alanine amidase [Pseudidiomarina andamanensis]MDS0219151.1 N-acetylmuramoyl-L-alanine amidase [Pseudidiomarina andamanensis]QGT96497.1 AMIN domain-containing protein [Pseudidiomarina andamanensis]